MFSHSGRPQLPSHRHSTGGSASQSQNAASFISRADPSESRDDVMRVDKGYNWVYSEGAQHGVREGSEQQVCDTERGGTG